MLAKAGLQRRKLTPAEVYDIEPALRAEVLGGYYTDSDFTGDIHKFTNGLAEAARQAGVNFAMNTQITDIQHEGDTLHLFWEDLDGASSEQRFDGVVITAGVMSRKLAAALGDSVNVYPVKGYSITVDLKDAVAQAAAPTVSLLDDAAKIVTARLGKDRFRVAGTAEINGINYDIRATRWVQDNLPR